jgi:hypothetical protein
VFSTTAAGISITDGTAIAATLGFSSDDLYITNNDPDGLVYITAEKSATGQSTLFKGDPDGAVELYYAGVKKFETSELGSTITGKLVVDGFSIGDNEPMVFGDGPDAIIGSDGTNFNFWNGLATQKTASFIGGGAVELYYAGARAVRTSIIGASVGLEFGGGADVGRLYHNTFGVALTNDVPGDYISLRSQNTADDSLNIVIFGDPDGAVELYYAGVLTAKTIVNGWEVGNSAAYDAAVAIRNTNGFVFLISHTASGTTLHDDQTDSLITLTATNAADATKTLFKGDPDGAAELYYAGVKAFETVAGGILMSTASTGEWKLAWQRTGGDLWGIGTDSTGTYIQNRTQAQMAIRMYDEGSVELYHAGVKKFETTAAGISITDGVATSSTIGFVSDDLYITGNDPGGDVFITAETDASGQRNVFRGDPDGHVYLYEAGIDVLRTRSGGINIGTAIGSGTRTSISSGTGGLDINQTYHGGQVLIQAEDTGGVGRYLFLADPDGAAELYHAGVKTFETDQFGFSIFRGSLNADINLTDQGEFDIVNHNPSAGYRFYGRNTADDAYNVVLAASPDGAAELYYAGVKKFETKATGALVTGSMYLTEQAAALADVAAQGQLWVKNDDGNVLMFTDGDGTDYTVDLTPV